MSDRKLCKDCKWSVTTSNGEYFMECHAPQNIVRSGGHPTTDLITGEMEYEPETRHFRYRFCSTHRQAARRGFLERLLHGDGQTCSASGLWWQRRT